MGHDYAPFGSPNGARSGCIKDRTTRALSLSSPGSTVPHAQLEQAREVERHCRRLNGGSSRSRCRKRVSG